MISYHERRYKAQLFEEGDKNQLSSKPSSCRMNIISSCNAFYIQPIDEQLELVQI
jgi:hypothetical protein